MTLEQEREINALLLRYATAADNRDRALLESCFTADVKADYGEVIGSFRDRNELVTRLIAMLETLGPSLHFITNIVCHRNAAGARVRSYTHAIVTLSNSTEQLKSAGTYDDLVVDTVDGWKISERIYQPLG